MQTDTVVVTPPLRVDSLIEHLFRNQPIQIYDTVTAVEIKEISQPVVLTEVVIPDLPRVYQPVNLEEVIARMPPLFHPPQATYLNDYYLYTNPFFSDIRFKGFSSVEDMFRPVTMENYFLQRKKDVLVPDYFFPAPYFKLDNNIRQLREKTIRRMVAYHPHFIAFNVDKLPDVSDLMTLRIDALPINRAVMLTPGTANEVFRRIEREKVKVSPWTKRSNAMLQFSQNYISDNWYQGGSDNMAILGILNGRFNYDNKKGLQWENFIESRLGFNSVEGDTLRFLNTNDDILRANSKIGIKAGGNWFYSGSVDFQTQFFNSYRAINSTVLRTTFLTPVRLSVGVGMDYKYKRTFSLMLAPVSYRFIYANDTVKINQRSFGIPVGEKVLSQLGSSFRAEFTHSTYRDIQINSKLWFYTNYERFEVDLEITGNFIINRYLSTRISLNPRYDNTVYIAAGEKAKLQFKQLLTFGLSYRLL